MRAVIFTALLASLSVCAFPAPEKRAISATLFSDFVRYWKYSTSSYSDSCASPNNNTLIGQFSLSDGTIQGFVARDDTLKEYVVAFRGTSSQADFTTDFDFELIPYSSNGVSPPSGASVHQGFLKRYNAYSNAVISLVKNDIASHSTYSIVVTGHSLGGGVASIAGPSLKAAFPGQTVRLYTFGQPRTGNPAYAAWIDNIFGANAYRVVHRADSVPSFVPPSLGYRHHDNEYWINPDPATAATVKPCSGDEDTTCSDSIPSTMFLNQDHLVYFGIFFVNAFC